MNKRFLKRVLVGLGIDLSLKSPDRKVLEQTLLPWLSRRHGVGEVLFVGCDWYTRGYRKWFRPDGYTTLDFDPDKKLFGSSSRHITDSMANLSQHVAPGSLDLVICNGVFGWGLDDPADIEAAFSAAAKALRSGGLFLFGWNDTPGHRPMQPDEINALAHLRPVVMEPLGVSRTAALGEGRHVFQMFSKP